MQVRMRYIVYLIVCVTFSVVVTTFFLAENVFFYVEKPFLHLNLKLRGKVTKDKDVVIVDIDRHSIETYGRWPWKRGMMARLVDSASRLEPKAIGIDILFAGKSNPVDDRLLVSSIKKAGNVVLATVESINIDLFIKEKEIGADRFTVGHIDIILDESSDVLGFMPVYSVQNRESKAFSLMLAEKYGAIFNEAGFNANDDLLRINFYGPAGTFKHYSADLLLRGDIRDSLKGKVVIIGSDIVPLDLRRTPFGLLSLAEVEANAVQNFIDSNFLRQNKLVSYLTSIAVSLLFAIALLLKKGRIGLFLIFIILVFSYALFLGGVVISFSNNVVCIVVNYFIFRFFSVCKSSRNSGDIHGK